MKLHIENQGDNHMNMYTSKGKLLLMVVAQVYLQFLDIEWKEADSIADLVEVVLNVVSLDHMVRNYSFAGLTLLRVCHDVRWFSGCGVGDGEKQRKILAYFIDTVLKANSTRGREDRPPLDYAEVLEQAKRAAHSFNIFDNRLLGVGRFISYKI